MNVAVAFDHRGVKLRERVLEELARSGTTRVDLGTDTDARRVDYPDKARELGEAIQSGDAERGVLVCGSGVGASVAACKLAGIRAAICHDVYSAHQGVEHDDMNVLCLGSEVIGAELAVELVRAFLGARFDGGERYVERLRKVAAMEKEMKDGQVRLHELYEAASARGSTRSRARCWRRASFARLMKRRRDRRRHLEPDDLPEGARHRRVVRRAARRAAEDRGRPDGDLPPARWRTSGARAT